ncbi:MAG TPA: hypothetical protein VF691_10660 [Cytophagaceae bacterium]|jgi:hypothetical protein
MKNIPFLFLLPFLLSSCATVYQPTFSGDPVAYKIYTVDGKKIYGQNKNGLTCEVAIVSHHGSNFVYEIFLENNDTNAINISPTQVQLTTHSLKGKTATTPAINVDPIIADLNYKINKENDRHGSVRKAVQNDKFFNTVGDVFSIGRKKSEEEKEKRRLQVEKRDADWNLEVRRHNTDLAGLTKDLNYWSNGTLKATTLLHKNSVTGNVLIPRTNKINKSTLSVHVGEGFGFDFDMNPVK